MIKALISLMIFISLICAQDSGTFTDGRDGTTYKWVRIGEQIWMAEGLKFMAPNRGPKDGCPNIGVFSDGVGDYSPDKNGYYYDWAVAMDFIEGYWPDEDYSDDMAGSLVQKPQHRGIAPEGYHIPTEREVDQLLNYLGGGATAVKKLASTDWIGTNEVGFNALPGGYVSVP